MFDGRLVNVLLSIYGNTRTSRCEIDYASRASTIEVGAKDVVCQWSRAHGNNRRADAIEHVR